MSISLICMLLDYGRESEYLEETKQAQGEQANYMETDPAGRNQTLTLKVQGHSANQYATVPPMLSCKFDYFLMTTCPKVLYPSYTKVVWQCIQFYSIKRNDRNPIGFDQVGK